MHLPPRSFMPVLVLAALGTVPAAAGAMEPMHVEPSETVLTLGTATPARLIHVTLTKPGDTLRVEATAAEADGPLLVELLVPDRLPERDRAKVAEQPRLQVSGAHVELLDDGSELARVDEGSGLAYLPRARTSVQDSDARIVVRRGGRPVRVALLIGPDAPFATTDPRRVARTMGRIHAWYDTPAPGSEPVERGEAKPTSSLVGITAWFGIAVSLVAMATAFWWIRSGLRRARVRGIERNEPH